MHWRKCPECNGKLYEKYYKEDYISVPFKFIKNKEGNPIGLISQIECKKCKRKLKYMLIDCEMVHYAACYMGLLVEDISVVRREYTDDDYICESKIYNGFIWGIVTKCYKSLVNGSAFNKNESIIIKRHAKDG